MSDRERIEMLIEALGISARQFADEIRVQPSTISNMMVGRNNPSLDVMKRILLRYPGLNSEWLIAGRGDMWRDGQMPADVLLPLVEEEEKPEEPKEEPQPAAAAPQKQIRCIMVYYTDGTYEEYSRN